MKEIRELRFCGYLAPGFFPLPSPLFFWCQKSAARRRRTLQFYTWEKRKKNCISSPLPKERRWVVERRSATKNWTDEKKIPLRQLRRCCCLKRRGEEEECFWFARDVSLNFSDRGNPSFPTRQNRREGNNKLSLLFSPSLLPRGWSHNGAIPLPAIFIEGWFSCWLFQAQNVAFFLAWKEESSSHLYQ